MKILEKMVVVFIVVLCLSWITILLTGYTLVIPVSKYLPKQKFLNPDDTINPLKNLDFSKGTWSAYLVIDWNDFKDLNTAVKKYRCLKTTDTALLNRMKSDWNFKYSGGDMTTTESEIYFLKDGELIFKSGIVVDKSQEGLQSKEYGWLEPINKNILSKYCKDFKRTYWPIVFL